MAKDATAQTFLVGVAAQEEFFGARYPLAWLLGVTRRTLAAAGRAASRQSGLRDRVGQARAPVPPDPSAGDAARVLGCSPAAFAVRLHRARRRLRARTPVPRLDSHVRRSDRCLLRRTARRQLADKVDAAGQQSGDDPR